MEIYGGSYSVYVHLFPNGKTYVGLTSQKPERRWNQGSGYVPGTPMYYAIQKYGWDNIEHVIVASGLNKEEASNFERLLISKLDSLVGRNGYNVSPGGFEGPRADVQKIMSLWEAGLCIKDIERVTGHQHQTVTRILLNVGVDQKDILERGKRISAERTKNAVCTRDEIKPIDEIILSEWKLGYNVSQIASHIGVTRITVKNSLKKQEVPLEDFRARRQKKVDQFSLDGVFLKTFRSVREAAASVGAKDQQISYVCHRCNKKEFAGYIWVFSTDQNPFQRWRSKGGDSKCTGQLKPSVNIG